MSDQFESGFFGGRLPAWHGQGNVITEDVIKGKRAIKVAGLDWLVKKIPMFGVYEGTDGELEIDFTQMGGGIVREDTLAPLGLVGPDFEPFQNHQLFEFAEAIQDSGEAMFHTAGSLKGGRVVWCLARLVEGVKVAGDDVAPFLLVTNAHDGSRALTALMTPVRVVCANTLNLALMGAVRAWSVRHTSGIHEKAREARHALELSFTYLEQMEKAGDALAKAKMTKGESSAFFEALLPMPPEVLARYARGEEGGRAATNVEEARNAVRTILTTADDLDGLRDRKWGHINAVAEYVDHGQKQRSIYLDNGEVDEAAMGERRFVRTAWDNELKQRSLKILAPDFAAARGENLEILGAAR